MKVAITAVIEITGKDGREWTKICYIKPGGETGYALLPKGKVDLTNLEPVDLTAFPYEDEILFGERGYVEDIR